MNGLGRPASVLVLGGTSDIAVAIVDRLVAGGTRRVVLAARDLTAAERVAGRWRDQARVDCLPFDAADTGTHERLVDTAFVEDVDLVVLAFGVLGDQLAAEADPRQAVETVTVNYVGAVSLGLLVAERFRRQGTGTLAVLSSVAGLRARRANFIYGSSKAGLDAFAQGLGDALHGSGATVMVVRPGFVTSKMTAGMSPAPFSTDPDGVAEAVVAGLQKGSAVVYAPPALRLFSVALRLLPRPLLRRLPR